MLLRTKILFICITPILLVTISVLWLTINELHRLRADQVESTGSVAVKQKQQELRSLVNTAVSAIKP